MKDHRLANRFFIGVDVGTASVRAGIFDAKGKMLAATSNPIRIWRPATDFVEQSSENIWRACGQSIKKALNEAGLSPQQIAGIGFDATCSLVVVDPQGAPVTVSPTGKDQQNIIVWMDHRAIAEAEEINSGGYEVLKYVGGRVSPEMQTPKLLWLKRHKPQTWNRAGYFFDLADWLTWRCTGDSARSLCTTVCKWTYLGHKAVEDSRKGWDDEYFRKIGLPELAEEGYKRIGVNVKPMGEPLGKGLAPAAASDLGLRAGCPVGVGIIDAHAGGLGMLGAAVQRHKLSDKEFEKRLALIGGTSSCHMAVSREPRFVPGVWGPYYSAMIPEMWLTEGGQSATGSLVDHTIFSHCRSRELQQHAEHRGLTVYQLLNDRLEKLADALEFPALLTRSRHILPYFHGNRSPRANPNLRGIMTGLKLDDSMDELALNYLATLQSIAYGTRHIVETLNEKGYRIDTIFACGGGTKNPVFLREHADITGCRIILPCEPEAVLLGSAVLGAVASGVFGSLIEAMGSMNAAEKVIEPAKGPVADYHEAKYKVFLQMYDDWTDYEKIMQQL